MCLVLLLLDFHLFLSSQITLIVSCSIVTSDPRGFNGEFVSINHTCDSKKYFIHMTKVMALSTPKSSASVELLVLIFVLQIQIVYYHVLKLDRLGCDSYSLDVLQMKHQYFKLVFHYHLLLQLMVDLQFFQVTDNFSKFLVVLFYWCFYTCTQKCYQNLYASSCSLTCK